MNEQEILAGLGPDDQLKDLTTVQDVVNFVGKNAGGSA